MDGARSRSGCWTCRLRHRKCDEASNTCNLCVKNGVHCYGYGPKPKWMDGGTKERSQALRIKAQAKRARSSANSSRQMTRVPPIDNDDSAEDHTSPARQRSPSASRRIELCSFEEAALLMHFLDVILPLQFPYHADHRRGATKTWLFWLLNKNSPLRDAALSLSALHRSRTNPKSDDQLLHIYHTKALEKLRTSLQLRLTQSSTYDCEELAELLAVGTCLISFEVFQDGVGDWHLHLRSLAAIVELLEPVLLDGTTDVSSAKPWLIEASQFTVGIVVWFDVLSTATLGTAPLTNYRKWLDSGFIEMAELIGCQNWLLGLVGDIAMLGADMNYRDTSSSVARAGRISNITHQLQHGFTQLDDLDESNTVDVLVTRVFAHAASIQLLTIASGPDPNLWEIRRAVADFTTEVTKFPVGKSIRGLVWPICIAGSMVEPAYQHVFETLLSRIIPNVHRDFGNCAAVLRVLRTCWAMRLLHSEELWDWRKTMSITQFNVLLV